MTTFRERLLAGLLSLIAAALFFGEYLRLSGQFHLFSDIQIYHYPLARFALHTLQQGRIPQWDSSMYCGIPFAGNIQAALFYPPAWLLYAVQWRATVLNFRALEAFAFAHVWLAFLLAYLWLRARRLRPLASVFGAGVFAFGGYMMWQIVHLGVVTALAWMPLALWGIDDAVERRSWRPLWKTALASALWFLAGYPPSWLAFCLTIVLYAAMSAGRWRAAAGAALAIGASLLLAMAQVLPALEASAGMFWQTRYTSETRSAIIPLFVANWRDFGRASTLPYLDCLYVYLGLPAAFAVLWIARRRKIGPYAQPLAVMAFCLFFVLDPGHVIYYTIRVIPLFERTLQSHNFFEGATAMAALITATAISDFLRGESRWKPPLWAMSAVTIATVGWAARQLVVWARGGAFADGWGAVAQTAAGLALFTCAIWIVRAECGVRRMSLTAALALFVLCDYKVYGTNRLFNTRDGDVAAISLAEGIRGVDEAAYQAMWNHRDFRVVAEPGGPSAMEFRMWGLATPQGLDPLLPQQYRTLIERWGAKFETTRVFFMDYRNDEMLQTLGVRYVISYRGAPSEPLLSSSPDFRRVGPDTSFYRVYEYQRARAPYGWEGVAGEARPVEWRPDRRAFRIRSERGGRFGLVEQFFPGWRATVDGRPVPIERWREAFQAVEAPPGEHALVFEYQSRRLPLGGAISLLACAGLVWVMASDRRRAAAASAARSA